MTMKSSPQLFHGMIRIGHHKKEKKTAPPGVRKKLDPAHNQSFQGPKLIKREPSEWADALIKSFSTHQETTSISATYWTNKPDSPLNQMPRKSLRKEPHSKN